MKRAIYIPLGLLFLSLGVIGIFLPVLPTTPFVLLAAWFFAQSSQTLHKKLVESELFGPIISNWETKRCISRRTKIVSLITMIILGGASITFAIESPTVKIIAATLMAIGATTILLLKTCPDCSHPEDSRPS